MPVDSGVREEPSDDDARARTRPPELIEAPEPEYPEEARAQGLEPTVPLRLTVDATGAVVEAEVLEPIGQGFDEAACAAAFQLRFQPAERNGAPAASRILFEVRFHAPRAPEPELATSGAAIPSDEEPARQEVEITPAPDQEVLVSGARSEAQGLRDSAEAVTVVEMDKAKQQTADLGEVLARIPGVSVRREGGLGSGSILALNGLQGQQIGVFVDGVPEAFSGYPGGIVNIPVNIVERVEIYRGVVPARFGLDALGGAINVVTKTGGKSYLNSSYQTGSYGLNRWSANGRYQKDGFVAQGNAFVDLALNNYVMSRRLLPLPDGSSVERDVARFHNAYRSYGGHLELGVVEKSWAKRLLFRGFASTSSSEIQTNPTMTVPYGDVHSGTTSYGGSVQYEIALLPKLELEVLLNYAHRQIDFRDMGTVRYRWTGEIARPLGTRGEVRGEINGTAIDTSAYEHLYLARLGLLAPFSKEHSARLYATPQFVTRSSYDFAKPATNHGLMDTATQLVIGAEVQQNLFDGKLSNILLGKYYLFQPTSQSWVTREGLDSYVHQASREANAVGAGDSLRYKFTDWISAKASYEYAVRLPNPDELFGDGRFVQSNSELNPERSHNVNLGPRVELEATPLGAFIVDINGFWRETSDLIVLIVSEQFAPYKNLANARSTGVEGSLWWRSPGDWLVLDGSMTWMDSINTSTEGPFRAFEGMRIPSRPYRFASWGARLHLGNWPHASDSLNFFYGGRYVHGFHRGWEIGNPKYKMTIPDQVSHAVGITYSTLLLESGLYTATIEVDNLTDAELYDMWGVQRPGRSLHFKIMGQL